MCPVIGQRLQLHLLPGEPQPFSPSLAMGRALGKLGEMVSKLIYSFSKY